MRVFVAGATGAVGRRLLPMLRQADHDVTGASRTEEGAGLIRDLGGEAVVVDVFDAAKLRQAVTAARPDAVVHQLTSIPKRLDPKHFEEQFKENNRLRTDGTRNLVEASLAAGAQRIVAQSFGSLYEPRGRLHVEDDPLIVELPGGGGMTARAVVELEQAVTETDGIEGVALRYGYFYGPGTSYAADGAQADLARRRRLPIVGNGAGVHSFIHVDDAAAAALRALGDVPPGIYNIVDDEPAPVSEWIPAYCEALDAPSPRHIPVWLGRMFAGEYGVQFMTSSEGLSNEKAKRDLGLGLRYPSWRQGFEEALG
ncbi:MAG: NAD-dependent epimerase/dehydratase family protein [Thermoleophilaceae bacterium]